MHKYVVKVMTLRANSYRFEKIKMKTHNMQILTLCSCLGLCCPGLSNSEETTGTLAQFKNNLDKFKQKFPWKVSAQNNYLSVDRNMPALVTGSRMSGRVGSSMSEHFATWGENRNNS